MSATRDQSQKFTFVYSNLYHLYKKGQTAAREAQVPESSSASVAVPSTSASLKQAASEQAAVEDRGIQRARILKSEDLRRSGMRIDRHEAPRLTSPRLNLHRPLQSQPARAEAVEGLRQNLKTLQNLHERLRFMLRELEDLVNTRKD